MESTNLLQELVLALSDGIPEDQVLNVYFKNQGSAQDLSYYVVCMLPADDDLTYALLVEIEDGHLLLEEDGMLTLIIVSIHPEIGAIKAIPAGDTLEILKKEFTSYLMHEWILAKTEAADPAMDMQAVMVPQEDEETVADGSAEETEETGEIGSSSQIASLLEEFEPVEYLPFLEIGGQADIDKTENMLGDLPDDDDTSNL